MVILLIYLERAGQLLCLTCFAHYDTSHHWNKLMALIEDLPSLQLDWKAKSFLNSVCIPCQIPLRVYIKTASDGWTIIIFSIVKITA